jgi:hypothetical protein
MRRREPRSSDRDSVASGNDGSSKLGPLIVARRFQRRVERARLVPPYPGETSEPVQRAQMAVHQSEIFGLAARSPSKPSREAAACKARHGECRGRSGSGSPPAAPTPFLPNQIWPPTLPLHLHSPDRRRGRDRAPSSHFVPLENLGSKSTAVSYLSSSFYL